MQVSCKEVQLVERAVFEQGVGAAGHSPGMRSGPETNHRTQSDATKPGPLALETFHYSIFFPSCVFAGTDRFFLLLHNGCHVASRASFSPERALLQHHGAIRNLRANFIGSPKGHFGVELSTLCRVLVEAT